jgi:hypothetical protein
MKPLIPSPHLGRQILKQNQHPEKDFSHGLGLKRLFWLAKFKSNKVYILLRQ